MARRQGYERDAEAFPADAYSIKEHGGIAWHVLGWQTEPDEDTEWSGMENRTGRIVAVMVGDDAHWLFDPEEVTPMERDEYCGECGQVGCCGDAYPREETA